MRPGCRRVVAAVYDRRRKSSDVRSAVIDRRYKKLGPLARGRLRGAVLLALIAKTSSMLDSLADYPRWFVVACGTIVAAVSIWVVMKLLKLTMWLLIFAVLVVGLATAAWLLLK